MKNSRNRSRDVDRGDPTDHADRLARNARLLESSYQSALKGPHREAVQERIRLAWLDSAEAHLVAADAFEARGDTDYAREYTHIANTMYERAGSSTRSRDRSKRDPRRTSRSVLSRRDVRRAALSSSEPLRSSARGALSAAPRARRDVASSAPSGFFASNRLKWAFEDWLEGLSKANAHTTYGFDSGRQYLKVWSESNRFGPDRLSRSVVAFVAADGTVYHAESWKKRGRPMTHVTAHYKQSRHAAGRDQSRVGRRDAAGRDRGRRSRERRSFAMKQGGGA